MERVGANAVHELQQQGQDFLLFFHSPMCPHCVDAKPGLEAQIQELRDSNFPPSLASMKAVSLNVLGSDEAGTLSQEMGIRTIPAMKLMVKGKPVMNVDFRGLQTGEALGAFVQQALAAFSRQDEMRGSPSMQAFLQEMLGL